MLTSGSKSFYKGILLRSLWILLSHIVILRENFSNVSEVRPKSASKCFLSNQNKRNSQDSGKNVPTNGPSNSGSSIPERHKMDRDDMKFPIFNGNGLEVLEQHMFLCEAIWTM